MEWESNFRHPKGWAFKIKYDTSADVYYLYVWNAQGDNTHDYDQDTLQIAMEQALEDFGVPLDSWTQA